jgi:hypothetical protein
VQILFGTDPDMAPGFGDNDIGTATGIFCLANNAMPVIAEYRMERTDSALMARITTAFGRNLADQTGEGVNIDVTLA